MNISVHKLLAKIEEELTLAKNCTKEESLREKVYSIKILSELILDEKPGAKSAISPNPITMIPPVVNQPAFQQPMINQQIFQPTPTLQQPKKLEMEGEANGDSLFDF